jgi:hypothetical protein
MIHTYVEQTDTKFRIQLGNFCNLYPTYIDELNVLPAKMVRLNKGNAVVQVIFPQQEKLATFGTGFTSYKNLLRWGNNGEVLTAFPTMPTYPETLPALCEANIESLFKEILQDCVDNGMTEATAKILGVFAEDVTVLLGEGTPNFSLKLAGGGHPLLHCTIKGYDGFEIWKDTGTGFIRFDVSTSPNYMDMTPLPPAGTDVIWRYKIIYRYQNLQIGNWSPIIPIAIKGV